MTLDYNNQGWLSRDHMGSEYEMGDFLYGLVRMAKPKLVVETGCYFGDTTAKIALALFHNEPRHEPRDYARLIACDSDPEKAAFVTAMLRNFPVEVRNCKSEEVPEIEQADLLFSDSGTLLEECHGLRFAEFERAKPGCLWVVHDAHNSKVIGDFVRAHGGMVFPYSRGFGLLLKPL